MNEGFLSSEVHESEGVSYWDVADLPLIALLGAPGVGKSTAFQHAISDIESRAGAAIFISFGQISRVEDLLSQVDERIDLIEQGEIVAVFLDALDECPANILAAQESVLTLLRRIASGHFGGKELLVRVSCRTSDWSSSFEQELAALSQKLRVFELVQFSEQEASEYASRVHLDGQRFIDEIEQSKLTALASLPITLQMLTSIKLQTGEFPVDKASIYRQGLIALASESNFNRRALGSIGAVDAPLRIAIAARIAAIGVLSGATCVWDGAYGEVQPPESLALNDIIGGEEYWELASTEVSIYQLREVIHTGLFQQANYSTFIWTHKSFSEFLAAQYIVTCKAPLGVVLDLLQGGEGTSRGIAPQLREVAAWLAGFNSQFLDHLLENQPELLLESDVAISFPDARKRLVGRILEHLVSGKAFDSYAWRDKYRFLKHSELSSQLRPAIFGEQVNIFARRFAIDVAESCKLVDLRADLLELALRNEESEIVRKQAMFAVIALDGDKTKLAQVLKNGLFQPDPDDEMRGCLLSALWPNQLSKSEVFDYLSPPKEQNFIGLYCVFLQRLNFHEFEDHEAIRAIDWLARISAESNEDFQFDPLFGRVLLAAWNACESPLVMEKFAGLVIQHTCADSRLRFRQSLGNFEVEYRAASPQKRRRLLGAIFKQAPKDWERAKLLAFLPWQLVLPEDLEWLVEDFATEAWGARRSEVIELILYLIDWSDSVKMSWLWDSAANLPELKVALDNVSTDWLDSDTIKWRREDSRRAREQSGVVARPREAIQPEDFLVGAKSKSKSAWWRFNSLVLTDESRPSSEFTGSLLATKFWQQANQEIRNVVLDRARSYLESEAIKAEDWLKPNTHFRPAAAGYRALRLLRSEKPDWFMELSPSTWRNWIGPILTFSSNDPREEREIHSRIASEAYRIAPADFVRVLEKVLAEPGSDRGYQVCSLVSDWAPLEVLSPIWQCLVSMREDSAGRERVAQTVVERGFPPATDRIRNFFEASSSPLASDSLTALLVAKACLTRPAEYVPKLIGYSKSHGAAAQGIWMQVARQADPNPNRLMQDLSEPLLAETYLLLQGVVPAQPNQRMRFLGPHDYLHRLADQLVSVLVDKGTEAAVEEIRRIHRKLPGNDWLKWRALEAQVNARRRTWRSIPAAKLLTLFDGMKKAIRPEQIDPRGSNQTLDIQALSEAESFVEQAQHLENSSSAQSDKSITFLFVCTEWSSVHGGLPTLNRKLCKALAARGHTVICFVPSPTNEEVDEAKHQQVSLVGNSDCRGLREETSLAFGPDIEIRPDVVVGHAHVTGPVAKGLARKRYNCKYVHVVHTLAEELAPYKTDEDGMSRSGRYLDGQAKWENELWLCNEADLVLAVGPRIFNRTITDTAAQDPQVNVIDVRPGIDEDLEMHVPNPQKLLDVNCLFSARQEDPLIKGTDIVFQVAADLADLDLRWKFVVRGFRRSDMDQEIQRLQSAYPSCRRNTTCRSYAEERQSIVDEIKRSSLVLMPSRTEGFGLAGWEAISAGVPVLVSSESGLGQLLKELAHEAGCAVSIALLEMIVPVRGDGSDVTTWSKHVNRVCNDREKYFKDALEVRGWLKSRLNWASVASEIEAALL